MQFERDADLGSATISHAVLSPPSKGLGCVDRVEFAGASE